MSFSIFDVLVNKPSIWTLIAIGFGFNLYSLPIQAQITSDDTLGSQINEVGNQQLITGGTRVETNLFHSFSQFSVPTGTVAYFNNNPAINNIFSRITGGAVSNIDGILKANGNASLFLLNPAGIIFGPNAQLNLGGSFIATTANSIIFADGTQFSAVDSLAAPLLTINIPIGLQYGTTPGAIVSFPSAQLAVTSGHTLALVGGDVELRGTNLNANSGSVEIGSIVGEGQVNLQPYSDGWQFSYDRVEELGQIRLMQGTTVDTSGFGGTIQFQGKNIEIIDNSRILNLTSPERDGGNIRMIARESIYLDRSGLATQIEENQNPEEIIAGNDGNRSGGNISMEAKKITLNRGSIVSTDTLSQGNGGNLTINATDLVELSGKDESLSLSNLLTTSTAGEGTGGSLTINTSRLVVRDGSIIGAASFGAGQAGTLTINATKSIELFGSPSIIGGRVFNGGLFASSGFENVPPELQPGGKSGNLVVNTPKLLIENNAQISVSNFGLENAGELQINASQLTLRQGGSIIATTASGEGGSIALTADSILLRDDSTISTTAARDGDGGNIGITADTIVLLNRSEIDANAFAGTGGNIQINTQGLFIAPDSQITASSNLGTDGVVEIVTPEVDSKINIVEQEQAPLASEDTIYTGCGPGTDFAHNQFNYIGRGGLPSNPLQEVVMEDVLGDLGTEEETAPSIVSDPSLPLTRRTVGKEDSDVKSILVEEETSSVKNQPIVEATSWTIDREGNIELIAQTPASSQLQSFACQLNSGKPSMDKP
ncbi:filamentous hemagglutinin N-terminal domain-containing protein [Pleurocapsales cyanobacterium LEGE 06147]|nr:filamentous hemagglutinin N-terminal domain-containing protein [Pleurocapsales cyanobacterium LEGE 06147]